MSSTTDLQILKFVYNMSQIKECPKGRRVEALYATPSWVCCFFCGGGAVYKENGWVGGQTFLLGGWGVKMNFGWGSIFIPQSWICPAPCVLWLPPLQYKYVKICLSRLYMKMLSFLFVRAWARPCTLYVSCGIPFPVLTSDKISGLSSVVVWLSRWEVIKKKFR